MRPPEDWTLNVIIWAVAVVALAVWQLTTVRSRELPAFGDLIQTARPYWILRWLLLAFWVWLG